MTPLSDVGPLEPVTTSSSTVAEPVVDCARALVANSSPPASALVAHKARFI
jgi:hypothetical protein